MNVVDKRQKIIDNLVLTQGLEGTPNQSGTIGPDTLGLTSDQVVQVVSGAYCKKTLSQNMNYVNINRGLTPSEAGEYANILLTGRNERTPEQAARLEELENKMQQ